MDEPPKNGIWKGFSFFLMSTLEYLLDSFYFLEDIFVIFLSAMLPQNKNEFQNKICSIVNVIYKK